MRVEIFNLEKVKIIILIWFCYDRYDCLFFKVYI